MAMPAEVEDIIIEIEKVLGAKEGNTRGHQIGKALKCLQNLDQNHLWDALQKIQNILKNDVLPDDASEVAKMFFSLKVFAKEQDEKRAADPLHNAFKEYAKNTAMAYATSFNAINIFGTTISYVIGDRSDRIKETPHIHSVFIAMTLAFLPISLLTVGMAHTLEHKPQWINRVAIMLIGETLYMVVMCILFGIYLMYHANGASAVLCVCGAAGASLIAVPWCVFKIPSDMRAFFSDVKAWFGLMFSKCVQIINQQEMPPGGSGLAGL